MYTADGQRDVTPLKPISDLFGLEWERQRKRVAGGNYYPRFFGTCTVHMYGADGQRREQNCILLSRVAAFLSGVSPERVQAAGNLDGADYLIAKQEEWADALHDYEELGVAINLNHHRVQGAKVNALIRPRACFPPAPDICRVQVTRNEAAWGISPMQIATNSGLHP